MPSKSFNFNWILPYAIKRFLIFSCLSEIAYGIYKVLLQNTFQSSMPLLNAFFGLSNTLYTVWTLDELLQVGRPTV